MKLEMADVRKYLDLERLLTMTIEFLPRLLVAIGILIAFIVLYRITRRPLSITLRRAGLHEKLVELIVYKLWRYAMVLFGLVMALGQLGVNVTAALAGLGIAGIALGFAAQDSVANVISGIMIFWDKPFVVGDWIKVEGEYGRVSDITLRSTRIRTPRNTFVVIPNKNIIDTVLENYSKHGETRVDVPIGIAYKEDIREARKVLLAAVAEIEHVRKEPAPDVIVHDLGDSSVNLRVRVWVDRGGLLQPTTFAVTELAKIRLDEAGIEIPFPHLQLFVENVEDRVWDKAARLPAAMRPGDGEGEDPPTA
jgi:small conductance mechanosensitive channel